MFRLFHRLMVIIIIQAILFFWSKNKMIVLFVGTLFALRLVFFCQTFSCSFSLSCFVWISFHISNTIYVCYLFTRIIIKQKFTGKILFLLLIKTEQALFFCSSFLTRLLFHQWNEWQIISREKKKIKIEILLSLIS